MANSKTKTSRAKTKEQGGASMTGGIPDKVSINIDVPNADKKRQRVHNKNIDKNNNKDVPQGKELNHKTYEFACDDCLDNVVAKGEVFCLYEETLNEYGRCKCGKYTTHKAILI